MQESGLAMDIRKWLAETEYPFASERTGALPDPQSGRAESVSGARQRQKRSSSDSSLLKVTFPQPPHYSGRKTRREHQSDSSTTAGAQSVASDPTCSEPTDKSTASQRYARKPRRKTRPDRYKAASNKAQGQDETQRQGRKGETRKTKRKYKRRKDEKTHNGIGHNFQARNVSKDRLTLKPLEKTGLFSKGKASTSAPSRGLPDLFFSEMRFLQNSHGPTVHLLSAKKRKRDNARSRKDDISAFFTSVRPALTDANIDILAGGGCAMTSLSAAKLACHMKANRPSTVPVEVVPAFKLEDKALHLGSDIGGPRRESNSSLSWSDSISAPSALSATPGRCRDGSSMHRTGVHPPSLDLKAAAHDGCAPVRHRRTSLVVREPVKASLEQTVGSSAVPMPSSLSGSRSLSQHSSPPRRPNPVERATHLRTSEGVMPPSSLPPVLQASVNSASKGDFEGAGSRSGGPTLTFQASEYVEDPLGQIPLDMAGDVVSYKNSRWSTHPIETLQRCDTTSRASHRLASRSFYHDGKTFAPERRHQGQQLGLGSYEMNARRPTVQCFNAELQPSRLPHFSGTSFYVQQENRRHRLLPDEQNFEEKAGDLGAWRQTDQDCVDDPESCEQEEAAGLSGEPSLYETWDGYDDGVVGMDYVTEDVESGRRCAHPEVVTPGFWRPNRLY